MKKLRAYGLLITFFLCSNRTFSQTEHQSVLLGGNADISYSKQSKDQNFSINLNPNFGYFVAKNFMLGFQLSIGISSTNNSSTGGANQFLLSSAFSPMTRYYFLKGKVRPFLHGQFGYISITVIQNGEISNLDGIAGGGGIGLNYFLTKNVALEGLARYHGAQFAGLPFISQFIFGVGFQYYFHPTIKKEMLPL